MLLISLAANPELSTRTNIKHINHIDTLNAFSAPTLSVQHQQMPVKILPQQFQSFLIDCWVTRLDHAIEYWYVCVL